MKPSITVLLLLATVSCLTGGTKQAVKTGNGDVAFTLEWWDDGYTVPYQVYSKNRDVTAHHKFDSDGRLFQITVGSTTCTFYWDSIDGGEEAPRVELADSGDETLLGQDEEIFVNDVGLDIVSDPRDLHACYGCESTHEAMCHQGLEDTCYWAANVPESFSDDCELAITTLCSAFTEACMESSEAACTAQCAGVLTPTPVPTPSRVPASRALASSGSCSPNPCLNGGSCSEDEGGGHICTCASGYGGMACQTDTSLLAEFYIEVSFIGIWASTQVDAFQSAADRWAEVITHVPCGGGATIPAGRLLISATLAYIDGTSGILGSAGPDASWLACPGISYTGSMNFDVGDVIWMQNAGTFESVIMHEMGHVIGLGTMWGPSFGDCSSCSGSTASAWTCPSTLEVYYDLGGTDANIIETEGGNGTACVHLDEAIFVDELMTGWLDPKISLSKMTAALLEDIGYIVDPSMVDPYVLPAMRDDGEDEASPVFAVNDTVLDTMIALTDNGGHVVEELNGIKIAFFVS